MNRNAVLRIGSLFTGYGGLDMAVEAVTGGHTVWRSDIDPGACKIIAHHWPDEPNIGDITTVDWSRVEPVDVITGGFPCQDVSMAGRRAGLRPGNRSGLWSKMAGAIDYLRPALVVAENVRGILSATADSDLEPCPWCVGDGSASHVRALGAVLGDLADLGYDAAWHGLRASDAGAPHGRFRVFVVAWPAADTEGHRRSQGISWGPQAQLARTAGDFGDPALVLLKTPTTQLAVNGGSQHPDKRREGGHGPTLADELEHLLPTPRATDGSKGGPNQRGSSGDLMLPSAVQQLLPTPTATPWGAFEPAVRRWETTHGPAPAPTETGPKGGQRLSPRFVEWMMGLPAGHVTDVPGLSRNEQLKALGNGVVPQQAEVAVQYLVCGGMNQKATPCPQPEGDAVNRRTRPSKSKVTHEQVIEVGKAVTADIDLYQRTGHCGQCCRPGRTCSCLNSARCGCWDLHDGNRDRHPEMESLALFEDAGPRRGKRYEMGA